MGRIETNAGEAQLHIGSVAGRSAVICSRARNPLRLLTPRARGESVWAYTSSLGGGMVAGDRTRLEVTVDAGARCFVGTQASTKIYRNPAQLPCSHDLVARVGEEALLILAPDPVQCFAESSSRGKESADRCVTARFSRQRARFQIPRGRLQLFRYRGAFRAAARECRGGNSRLDQPAAHSTKERLCLRGEPTAARRDSAFRRNER